MGACNSSGGGNTSAFISANSIQQSIHDSVKSNIEEKKTADNQTSFNVQNIKITYDYDPAILQLPPYNHIIKESWPWGTKKKDCGPAYGCSYDISQVSNISIRTVDVDKISSKSEIYNTVRQKLEKDADDTITGEVSIQKIADAKNLSQSLAEENIEKAINRFKDNYDEDGENIELVVKVPLKCPDPCTEGGNVIPLDQDAIVDNLINNITSETLNTINKETDSLKSDSSESTDDTNYGCLFQMAAFCICMLVILIIAIYFITGEDGESNDIFDKKFSELS